MAHLHLQSKGLAFGAVIAMAVAATVAPATAQDKPKADAPAQKQTAWVKLCEKAPVAVPGKDGKAERAEKDICLTHHERLDGNTGMVLVSAAVRQVEGSDKKSLMVMVPLGMALPAGVRAAVYTPDQWAKAAKNEKVDEKELKPVTLVYSLCHPAGCTAEVEATPELIDSMKKGGGIMVLAMNAQAQPIGFPVPLDGFGEAHDGKPVDNAEYAKARGALMQQIRERQQAAMKAFREAQDAKGDGKAAAPAEKKK